MSQISNPQTVADLVANLNDANAALVTDAGATTLLTNTYNAALVVDNAQTASDTAVQSQAVAAVAAQVTNGGPFGILSPDGSSFTGYDPNGSGGYVVSVYSTGATPIAPVPPPVVVDPNAQHQS